MRPHCFYLLAARQARLCALAWPHEADTFKGRACYWLATTRRFRRRAFTLGEPNL